MGTSRRSLLRGALALPVLAAPVAAATCEATPVISLWAERQRLLAGYIETGNALDAANDRLDAAMPPEPPEAIVPWKWRIYDLWIRTTRKGKPIALGGSIQWKRAANLCRDANRDECLRRAHVMVAHEAERERLFAEIIAKPSDTHSDAYDRLVEVEKTILAMPVVALRDIAMKVAIARRQDEEELRDLPMTATLAVLADIDRFAALAAT